MLRLDTLLLAGVSDITQHMVEENLSAVEFVRLSMCCKGLHAYLKSANGLMYLPMHRTFPCITGLALGRKSSYYLSILNKYFVDKMVYCRAFVTHSIWCDVFSFGNNETSVEEIISNCICEERILYQTMRGRQVMGWCLEEMRQCLIFENGHDPVLSVKLMGVLDHLVLTVNSAYCVINRHLLPGITRIKPLPAYQMEVDSDGNDN